MLLVLLLELGLQLQDPFAQSTCLHAQLVVCFNCSNFAFPSVELALNDSFLGDFGDLGNVNGVFFVCYFLLQLANQFIFLLLLLHMFCEDKLKFRLQLRSFLRLFLQLLQKSLFLGCGVLVHVVGKMGFFVIFSNVVDDLHVFIILPLQDLFAWKLSAQCISQDSPNVFSAFGQSDQESGIKAVFFLDFHFLSLDKSLKMLGEKSQLGKCLLAFFQHCLYQYFYILIFFLHFYQQQTYCESLFLSSQNQRVYQQQFYL